MQLGALTAPPPATDLAGAVRGAHGALGHRPAVTVLRPERREEQGFASLAQWAAKGAHLLETDHLVEPGTALVLDAPLSWTAAAVCLAAWWTGATIHLGAVARTASGAVRPALAVVHEARSAPAEGDVLWLGDDVDGAPLRAVPGGAWALEVQAFPDQPPRPHAAPALPALVAGAASLTQAELLATARELGPGPLGLVAGGGTDPVTGIVAVAVAPLVSGRPTVVLDGVGRDAAAAERVATWL